MERQKVISFIETERESQKITKRSLCIQADITPQYYDLLIKGSSSPNFTVLEALLHGIGYDLAVIKKI